MSFSLYFIISWAIARPPFSQISVKIFPPIKLASAEGSFVSSIEKAASASGQSFDMFTPCFLQNSCNSPRTRERTDVPAVAQNFFKSFGFATDPLNYALRIASYEVVFARVRAHVGEASFYLFDTFYRFFKTSFF
jgi:hypothetical protein